MFNISDFLEKFKKIDKEGTYKQEAILGTLHNVLQIPIPASSISIKNGILSIKGSPLLKSEIYLKKEALLRELLPTGIIDIR